MDVEESIAQALATAGSAVVFAGTTVIIALCGLAVAQIPFLSVMGLAAAGGVAVAVLRRPDPAARGAGDLRQPAAAEAEVQGGPALPARPPATGRRPWAPAGSAS